MTESRTDNKKVQLLYKLEIMSDNDPLNPITDDYDETGMIMVCSHREYNLGNKQGKTSSEVFQIIAEDLGVEFDYDIGSESEYDEAVSILSEKAYIEPVSLYDHGGISMFIGRASGWDCGQVGFIYIKKDYLEENYGLSDCKTWSERAEQVLNAQVELYSSYLEGEVYGFNMNVFAYIGHEDIDELSVDEIDDIDGENLVLISEDSCFGFYGMNAEKSGLFETALGGMPDGDKETIKKKTGVNLIGGEEYEISTEHLFDDLPARYKEKILERYEEQREELENTGLKMFVDEEGTPKIKIDGNVINNKVFTDGKTEWLWSVVKREELIKNPEYAKHLENSEDEYLFVSTVDGSFADKSSMPDVFDKICKAIVALSAVEDVLERNQKKRVENSENKTINENPTITL